MTTPLTTTRVVRYALAANVGLGLALVATDGPAVTQPGTNIVVPTDNEVRDALTHLGETIDPQTDAAITPERFRPQCNLTFTVLERLTDYKNSFGWYNVTGSTPQLTELYEFIHCSDPPNTWDATYTNQTSRTLDIRNDPRYLGGEIGFFQAVAAQPGSGCADVTQPASVRFVVYSEPALNPDSAAATQTIHLLTMNSSVQNNVFYFAWEDLLQGGDNDFSDLLLRVEGINCSGGGERCETGLDGVCADGATRCENGAIVCHPRQSPSDEDCNGLDDDCNGAVDDGDLCAERQICDRGRCIDACNTGEFRCPAELLCRNDGYCVDPACAEVTCPPGRICLAGDCVDACAGVVCPFEQECRAGRCVDPCAGIDCAEDQVCRGGACITTCECSGCTSGASCNRELKVCIEDACASVTCTPGTHCSAGSCVDDCAGAVCPPGQLCMAGMCVGDVIGPGDGEPRGGSSSIPIDPGAAAAAGMLAGAGGNGNASGAGTSGSGIDGNGRAAADSGCACRLAAAPRSRSSGSLLVALALGSLTLRRFSRKQPRSAVAPRSRYGPPMSSDARRRTSRAPRSVNAHEASSAAFAPLLGRFAELHIRRFGTAGAFLAMPGADPSAPTLLLLGPDIPAGAREGDELSVFVYLDSEGRPLATTRTPKLALDEVAFLRVTARTDFGAFVDWGLPKELLVPFSEQTLELQVGARQPIGLYIDQRGRLAGTMRVSEMLDTQGHGFELDEWLSGEAWRHDPEIGLFVIVERRFVGLLPRDEPHTLVRGEAARFRVSNLLPDGKVELSLRGHAHEQLALDAEHVRARLLRSSSLDVGDRTSPEQIRELFGLSKKAFKRAVGRLLKEGTAELDPQGYVRPKR